jgi:uncharacterized membrane protein YeaQ/YmgE (transglycosylase-associated protein family)
MLAFLPYLIIGVFKTLFVGSIIGIAETAMLYRSRATSRAFLIGILFGVVGRFVAESLAGWADDHSYILNGQRMDWAPWGENLWLRNRLVEYEFPLALLASFIPILIRYVIARRSGSVHRNADSASTTPPICEPGPRP